ncbi:DUF1330 domain-containing protein [Yoonia sp. R2331]|uniref:DUF1330 domain-containing protein n=1 Tax=Yoonia sp. R2331 TaxID=3237238 RepID=UPI0034E61D4F
MTYAIAHLTIADPESLAAYRELAGPALARHGGAVAGASGNLIAIDGTPTLTDTVAVLTFPDTQSAQNWINDPDLAETHALRRKAGQSDIVVLG